MFARRDNPTQKETADMSTFDDLDETSFVPSEKNARQLNGAHALIDPAAQLGLGVARSRANVARFKCDRCRGTGTWSPGFMSSFVGPCRKCKGSGLLKTDPAALARRRASDAARKVAAVVEWTEAHAAELQWMNACAARFDFAASMLQAVTKYGSLTDGQLAAVRRCMQRDAERAAVRAARPADAVVAGEGFARMLAAFAAAKVSGLKHPKFRVAELAFSLAGANSQNAGCLYVKDAAGTYLGKVTAAGGFFKSSDCDATKADTVRSVCADPLAAAVMHGKQTGSCSCCGRELENAESVALGIGPICREKWGL